jgi:hypothetical protein
MGTEEALKQLDRKKTFLIITPVKNLQRNINKIVEHLMKRKNLSCIYVSLNKPYTTIKQMLDARGVPKQRIFYIDCITVPGAWPKREPNILFVPNPSHLTEISIAIKQLTQTVGEDGFVTIDALPTFLIYNRPEPIASFIHSLTAAAISNGTKLIVLSTRGEELGLVRTIAPFFDGVIEVD